MSQSKLELNTPVIATKEGRAIRGKIIGVISDPGGVRYDVLPDGELSRSRQVKDVPASDVRVSGRPMLVKGAV